MDKAILVVDMPDNCNDCEFCYYSDGTVLSCRLKLKATYGHREKPDWCPLKPVPEKYNMNVPHDKDCDMEYEYGYNACIDEILGDEI